MSATGIPRAVLVTRPTEYEALLAKHGTRDQARFFLETRGRTIEDVEARYQKFVSARQHVVSAIPHSWRRSQVDRADLDRFLFEPEDLVIALGQDGLVANVAKYLKGQAVIGLNPDPDRYDGVLVPFPPEAIADLLTVTSLGRGEFQTRTMVEAVLDDGQRLVALNEVFLGHQSHQSARYLINAHGIEERHSSSGLIVATGTGCTGWARSIALERRCRLHLPSYAADSLVFFVREAFPSIATQTDLTEGLLSRGESLTVISQMDEGGAIFGDGIESDRIEFPWGMRATVRIAPERLNLLVGMD